MLLGCPIQVWSVSLSVFVHDVHHFHRGRKMFSVERETDSR